MRTAILDLRMAVLLMGIGIVVTAASASKTLDERLESWLERSEQIESNFKAIARRASVIVLMTRAKAPTLSSTQERQLKAAEAKLSALQPELTSILREMRAVMEDMSGLERSDLVPPVLSALEDQMSQFEARWEKAWQAAEPAFVCYEQLLGITPTPSKPGGEPATKGAAGSNAFDATGHPPGAHGLVDEGS